MHSLFIALQPIEPSILHTGVSIAQILLVFSHIKSHNQKITYLVKTFCAHLY